jgi:hypothetical protein
MMLWQSYDKLQPERPETTVSKSSRFNYPAQSNFSSFARQNKKLEDQDKKTRNSMEGSVGFAEPSTSS